MSLSRPEMKGISAWVNSAPLALSGLRGKTVLVEFWELSCASCLRGIPFLKALHEKYGPKGLAVVGVHTPEYEFGKSVERVKAAVARHGIPYPVALDNDYHTWKAFGNKFWPGRYLFDAKGELRYSHAGEGAYGETERKVRELLAQAGADVTQTRICAPPDAFYPKAMTPETYMGSSRSKGTGSGEVCGFDGKCGYLDPGVHIRDALYLSGMWDVKEEYAETASDMPANLTLKFFAREANVVMAPPAGKQAAVKAFIDNAPVRGNAAGEDVGEDAAVRVGEARMYRVYSAKDYGEHELRLDFAEKGVKCYSCTFG